ncbi:hypothetical protein JNM05_12920 [bacterium]|nr:hypothetical protein [bacterium]
MIKKIVLIYGWTILSGSIYGQTGWKEMTWPAYGMDFMLPENFKTKESSTEFFVAEGDGFSFAIQPWRDSTLSLEQVAAKALEQLDADEASITIRDKVDMDGFEGYEIIGAGKQEGSDMIFVVLGFIDPVSDANFSAYILFWHDMKTDDENIRISKQIIEGIRKSVE